MSVCIELPAYSVLMSVYRNDHSEWLDEAFDSMVHQSYPPNEIILIEDGPVAQDIHEIEEKYLNQYPGLFRVKRLSENMGLAGAMRYGLSECSCEWIARMDSDDLSDPFRCEKELKFALAHNADIVGCDCSEFSTDASKPDTFRVFPENHEELVNFSKRKTPFCHPSVMMKKSAVIRAGGYCDLYLLEDYDLFVRMLKTGSIGCTVKEVLYHVRTGTDFYSRRGGVRYVRTLLGFNYHLLKTGWSSPKDFIVRSCGNLLVGLAPSWFREWFYRRFLRK